MDQITATYSSLITVAIWSKYIYLFEPNNISYRIALDSNKRNVSVTNNTCYLIQKKSHSKQITFLDRNIFGSNRWMYMDQMATVIKLLISGRYLVRIKLLLAAILNNIFIWPKYFFSQCRKCYFNLIQITWEMTPLILRGKEH